MGQKMEPYRVALIVEDDFEVRGLAAALLEETDLKVVETSSAEEALDYLRQHSEEVAFLFADLRLPCLMDGLGSRPDRAPEMALGPDRAHLRRPLEQQDVDVPARCPLHAEAVAGSRRADGGREGGSGIPAQLSRRFLARFSGAAHGFIGTLALARNWRQQFQEDCLMPNASIATGSFSSRKEANLAVQRLLATASPATASSS